MARDLLDGHRDFIRQLFGLEDARVLMSQQAVLQVFLAVAEVGAAAVENDVLDGVFLDLDGVGGSFLHGFPFGVLFHTINIPQI